MRAIQQQEFGGPETLQLVELPTPVPADGEVLIEVSRAGLNFADTHQRTNSYVAKAELPLVPGTEVAGVRADTGERVIAICHTGGYAEYTTAPAALTFPIPDGVEDETALALLIQGLTAWHLYRTSARVQPGETVVVHSAAGGVGSLATQLGKPLGAGRVIASASTAEKRALALELGADAAIDGGAEGLTERLLEANGGRPVDVVFEMAGGAVFDASFDALAPLGRIVAYGIASREQNEIRTGKLLRTSRTVAGFWFRHCLEHPQLLEDPLAELFARTARGELRVVVGATYPLARAAQAQVDLAERRTTGKLLLDPRA
ncbi:NADPH:quinone oxidoreductase family protein [Conexibacter sp. CPCC 206217]|uniref:quinone oxidoreductase family protein n=1 Tax=Conexibacter sp. CPCC 206217 TaxID=3064574 RepID=UPI002722FE6E|nr:NADPH:quinone oxidoreductase family protein [Conexibacter sp. CPCC 206217]MDO8211906.1 NADPH:quinone oxidoreductase family protein [Conexibacter sp. CPCC 206217]